MKTYRGKRNRETGEVTVTVDDRPLDPRFGIANHSPDGFEWGYPGSGPAQLALALCCDALGDDDRAIRVYQFFKDKALVRLDVDTWVMTDAQVRTAVELIEKLERRPDPRKNANDAYAAFMAMPADEWAGLNRSLANGGILEPEEQKGYARAVADRGFPLGVKS